MKSNLSIYLSVFILIFNVKIYAQNNSGSREIKIDPRQYVTVQYKKTPTNGKLDTIWNWENRKNVPNQKFNFIDADGEIKIDFNKSALISNTDFEGTVSLEAEISGLNGTRKIEVNPYSEIGIQRIPIGIKSEPPSELANKILNMIKELKDAEVLHKNIFNYKIFSADNIIKNALVKVKFKELDSMADIATNQTNNLISAAAGLQKLIKNELDIFYFDSEKEYKRRSGNINFNAAKSNGDFQLLLDSLYSNYNGVYKKERNAYVEDYSKAFNYAKEQLSLVTNYLSSFDNSGEDAIKAFLSLINKDYINYSALKIKLQTYKDEIDKVKLNNKNFDTLALVLFDNALLISETLKTLSAFSRIKGSVLENILKGLALSNKREVYNNSNNLVDYSKRDKAQTDIFFSLLDSFTVFLSDTLSKAAGRIIFRKLVYATIDLGKSGAKTGEVLNVYVTWILDSRRDSVGNSPRLPIGKYYLRETGWRGEIADMFAMVKRIDESKADQSKVSPSNFKGSGGAVLMWTYSKEDRGIKIKQQANTDFKITKKNKFLNFLQPSVGLNVSYLDFSIDKDVEIGTGLQLGIFKNKIFFGYGLNLHMLSPKNQSPSYFYLGFSFARLSDLFKDSGGVTSIQ